jgi:hypothetical protein
MTASRSQILRLSEKLEGPTAKAFREAVAQIRSRARIDRLAAAIEAGDIERAFLEAGMREGSWSSVTETVRASYVEAGIFSMAANVPKRFGMTFNITNPRAEEWLRSHSSKFVTQINAEQRLSIMEVMKQGFAEGRNPRSTALDIVGRISPQTGRRAGGVIGLNGPQSDAVINARRQLENLDSAYFQRVRRDKRFDGIVRKAIDSGTPMGESEINKIIGRYEDRLLQLRGETIARTETLASLNEASDEAIRQAVDAGLTPRDAVTRIWRHSFSLNERPGHLAMSGQERGLDEPFQNPHTGAMLMHPGDGEASEVINCFDGDTALSYDSCKKSIRSVYDGELITVETTRGHKLTGTPNHPVMTNAGLIRLDQVQHTTNLVCCGLENNLTGSFDVDHVPTTFQELHDALAVVGMRMGVIRAPVNLYGRVANSQVDVIRAEGFLRDTNVPGVAQYGAKRHFPIPNFGKAFLFGQCLFLRRCVEKAFRFFSDSLMGVMNLLLSLPVSHFRPLQYLGFGLASDRYLEFNEDMPNSASVDVEVLSNGIFGFSRHVHFDNPISIYKTAVHDHLVYTIETEEGFYNAGGIIAQNCRCYLETKIDFIAVERAA